VEVVTGGGGGALWVVTTLVEKTVMVLLAPLKTTDVLVWTTRVTLVSHAV
jgi:hypothetical protein